MYTMSNLHVLCCILVIAHQLSLAECQEHHNMSQYLRQERHTLSSNIINTFNTHQKDRNQRAFITLVNLNSSLLRYNSCFLDINGHPDADNGRQISPLDKNCYGTCIISNTEFVSSIQQILHSLNSLLIQLPKLWNIYIAHHGRKPTMLLLYFPTLPCPECSDLLINSLSFLPYSNLPNIVLGYTSEESGSVNKQSSLNQDSINRLRIANIDVFRHNCLNEPSVSIRKARLNTALQFIPHKELNNTNYERCTEADTFQGCLLNCLDENVTCCGKITQASTMKANFINSLFANCGNYEFEKCASDWINRHVGNGCDCIKRTDVTDEILRCTRHCRSMFVMSNPLNPRNPSSFTGILQDTNELKHFMVEPVDCKDTRLKGQLCSLFSDEYITAGNSICRPDKPCGYYDEDYSWCYIDYSDNWDYCCTDECEARGENYLWCHSGSTWEYCGDGGTTNIMNRPCLNDHPCGLHDFSYFWCYEDIDKNWDYCCHPHSYCKNYEEEYTWCYTGLEFYSRWDYCYNLDITKNASYKKIV